MRYVLEIAYDGAEYCGWQVQPNGVTVQETLLSAAYAAFNEKCNIVASGRTDAGVHALSQVCHMDCEKVIPAEKMADALNSRLPESVRVLRSAVAPDGFDACRSAKKKTYNYELYFSRCSHPVKDRYAVWIKGDADFGKLKYALSLFEGEHDFAAYCASGSSAKTTVRTVYSATAEEYSEYGLRCVRISVCGNGFLYNMVRTIVGTALFFAQGRLTDEDIKNSLSSGGRSLVGKTMPPRGLMLAEVDYGVKLFKN